MSDVLCIRCVRADEEREQLHADILRLRGECAALTAQIKELAKVNELQAADLERMQKVIDGQRQPNQPERVNGESLQLAFEAVVRGLEDKPLAEAAEAAKTEADERAVAPTTTKPPRKGNRRELWKAGLPVIEERIVPDEVTACEGAGWRELKPEVTERVAFRRSRFEVIRTTRTRWVRVTDDQGATKGEIVAAAVPDWASPP